MGNTWKNVLKIMLITFSKNVRLSRRSLVYPQWHPVFPQIMQLRSLRKNQQFTAEDRKHYAFCHIQPKSTLKHRNKNKTVQFGADFENQTQGIRWFSVQLHLNILIISVSFLYKVLLRKDFHKYVLRKK